MSWQEVHGHDRVVDQFRRAMARERLASSFLFVGPPGIGKRTLALKLAQAIFCDRHAEAELHPCGHCAGCRQAAAGSHPDLLRISKPADKSFIPLESFIGDDDHRMRRGLCHDIALKPFHGGRRIAVIDDADHLNNEGANCLLKTLEEPPPKSIIILIATSQPTQLPTIRSRCQIVRFEPLEETVVADLLVSLSLVQQRQEADRLAALAQGSLHRAMQWSDPELLQFRQRLLQRLARSDEGLFDFAGELGSLIDQAGKEAPPRRERMRLVLDAAAEFYRQLMRTLGGAAAEGDDDLRQAVESALHGWPGDEQVAADALGRCFDALAQVDANANQSTLLECWLDDLASLARGRRRLVC